MWPSRFGQGCLYDLARSKDVKHLFATCQQVIGNDPAMTPPPYRLRTHNGAVTHAAELTQPGQARLKAGAHRVVGVVVKALIFPEAVDAGCNIPGARPEATKFSDMLIGDLRTGQGSGKRFAIILRICPRARDRAHIDHEADF